ncbi:barstar family protein [Streptomyces sp. PCS3-D2]|uniref:barstar family protein n=1 Tax=Streptomyces sp. PCS3-D2 TaxID=1460244 RepID=UPI00044B29B1|nr:barstar family protein [Streptomyces sp. PCS3-D2]WKV75076.1 barstar family protein [Streptomyces sp. PCS3-D2]
MTLHPQPLAPALAAAEAAGRPTVRLDLDGVRDKSGLMARCEEALRLPRWFGGNWDALADALRDLSWLPEAGAAGRLVAVTSWRGYAGARPSEWETFVDVLEEAVDFWRDRGSGEGNSGLAVVLDESEPESGHRGAAGAPPRTPRPGRRRG